MFLPLMKRLTVAAVLLLCVACETETVIPEPTPRIPESTLYLIAKGQHSTQSPFKFVDATAIRFEATFDQSARYSTVDPHNQADINKLYGVSDCASEHHTNSARFGWRWYNNRLEIHAYTYVNQKRNTAYITSIEIGKANQFELELGEEQYVFTVNGQQVKLPRACTGPTQGYQLYPYFGGDETAPQDISIRIKELE